MLLGILALYFYNHGVSGVYTFDVTQYHKLNLPFNLQWWVFLAFFLGFAIKVPMFPFHTWLPDAHTDAPTAGSVILAAVLLKMGTYGFLRFSLPMLPEATRYFVPMMVLLSIIGIVYGALVANKMWAAFAASGVVLGAAYMLYLYQRTMFGKIDNPKNERLPDLNMRELATFAPLIVLAVWIGLYPSPFLRRLDASVQHIVARVSPQYGNQNASADCDTTPKPELVARAAGAQFLAAAP